MGRPIKKIFIGERGAGNAGGEGVASVAIGGTADINIVDNDPLVFSAPDLVGGVIAAGYVVSAGTPGVDADIDSIVITEAGSGYTSVPTVSVANQANRTLTAVLTTTGVGVINCEADIGSGVEVGDIKAQKATRTYRVTTGSGTGECELVATGPAVGEMRIPALDSTGNSYWVTKLMNRTVILTQNTEANTFQFADGAKAGWADEAVLDHSVKITS